MIHDVMFVWIQHFFHWSFRHTCSTPGQVSLETPHREAPAGQWVRVRDRHHEIHQIDLMLFSVGPKTIIVFRVLPEQVLNSTCSLGYKAIWAGTEMWCHQTACQRLAAQWCHSSFPKIKLPFLKPNNKGNGSKKPCFPSLMKVTDHHLVWMNYS